MKKIGLTMKNCRPFKRSCIHLF